MRSAQHPATSWQHPPPPTTTATITKVKKLKCIVLGGANAGKTSILRRYFNGNFDINRMPTMGSDFYTRKMIHDESDESHHQTEERSTSEDEKKEAAPSPSPSPPPQQQPPRTVLSMQVWDTPGRERYAANRSKPMYTAAFSDNFFKNADAALLVYDITSSTSFTHVLKWHADLMERIRRLEATGERTRPFPVLIVANKMDKSSKDTRRRGQNPSSANNNVVPQRNVMGLLGKSFRGKDSRYEYSASPATNQTAASSTKSPRNRFELSTYMGTGDQTSYLEAILNNDVEGGSYLESLLSTEDGSHPDKDMVLLWCMRNGLKHMEVSALDGAYTITISTAWFTLIHPLTFSCILCMRVIFTGTGIDVLMNEMVKLALESAEHTIPKPSMEQLLKRNDELDLHRRYAPKPRAWFELPFHGCCKP
jgi:GTPase SAR1 family protein